ncbi:MAG TPA: AMP-binding protein, partial [Burkholderiaceae bacterium]|nr:AMP-binding protein [Burkholderiaceae bacterium]
MIRTDLIAPVGELLRRHASARPQKLAFEDTSGAAVTYGQLEALSASLAGQLQDRGLEPGDAVAILLPNSVDWVLACLSIARAGCVSVPISHEAVEAE